MGQRRTDMKQRRHTPEQVVRKLREGNRMLAEGKTLPEVAKALEVSENTGRQQGGGDRRAQGDREGKLVSPSRRRAAVLMLKDRLDVSERPDQRLLAGYLGARPGRFERPTSRSGGERSIH